MFRAIFTMLFVALLIFSPSVSTPKVDSGEAQEREKAAQRLRGIQEEARGVKEALQSLLREGERWDKLRALEEGHYKSTTPEEEDEILRELDKLWEDRADPSKEEKPERRPVQIAPQEEGLFA